MQMSERLQTDDQLTDRKHGPNNRAVSWNNGTPSRRKMVSNNTLIHVCQLTLTSAAEANKPWSQGRKGTSPEINERTGILQSRL